jgi:hypothetical protein
MLNRVTSSLDIIDREVGIIAKYAYNLIRWSEYAEIVIQIGYNEVKLSP